MYLVMKLIPKIKPALCKFPNSRNLFCDERARLLMSLHVGKSYMGRLITDSIVELFTF